MTTDKQIVIKILLTKFKSHLLSINVFEINHITIIHIILVFGNNKNAYCIFIDNNLI